MTRPGNLSGQGGYINNYFQGRIAVANIMLALAAVAGIVGCGEKTPAAPGVRPFWGELDPVAPPKPTVAELTKKAEDGDLRSQHDLGSRYLDGDGIPKDAAKAVEWYRKAAEHGAFASQHMLGQLYENGVGVNEDMSKAVEWYQKSALQGFARAQSSLGWAYWRGKGVQQDEEKAIEWWQKALVQGDGFALGALGSLYRSGKGVPKDEAKGMELIQKGVAQGDAMAQVELGAMYVRGDGVPKDDSKATELFLKAAEQGNSSAQSKVAGRYSQGWGVPKDEAKAAEWYLKAAAQGDADSQSDVGNAYRFGSGVQKDFVLAYAWINLAASSGDKYAAAIFTSSADKDRRSLEHSMAPADLAEAQRLSSGWKKGQILVRESGTKSAAGAPSSTGNLRKQGNGTIFVVSKTGHAITNQHVTTGCTELRIQGREGVAKLITEDTVNDLALVQIPAPVTDAAAITSEPGKLRQGEDIVAFGFPLNSLLSSGGNLTPGVVSALTGLGNNTNQIQITAPIQPGSSGSPVLNKKGEVVGVVSLKLSDAKMAQSTGQIGQNVNFAAYSGDRDR